MYRKRSRIRKFVSSREDVKARYRRSGTKDLDGAVWTEGLPERVCTKRCGE